MGVRSCQRLTKTKQPCSRSRWSVRPADGVPGRGLRRGAGQRFEDRLAAHDANGNLPPATTRAATSKIELFEAVDDTVGQTLGPYKLPERIGEGGCGGVHVAGQTQPVRRRVAVKVIKLGMDRRQVVARFEAERQALAMMDHPNIARVLDAGATEAGRP